MIYAIGHTFGTTDSGSKKVEILSCEDPQYVGRIWMNGQRIKDDTFYVVKFDPQDQFCNIVPLANIKKAGVQ